MWDLPPSVFETVIINPDGGALASWTASTVDGAAAVAGDAAEDDGDEYYHADRCAFYNGSYQYTGGICSLFALHRLPASIQQEAHERALRCAAQHETDCILSAEVGLAAPAAFFYDANAGLRMALAPKIIGVGGARPRPRHSDADADADDDADASDADASDADADANVGRVSVALQDPRSGSRLSKVHLFYTTITIEYVHGGTHRLVTERLEGSAAYCVQLLHAAYEPACWRSLV